MDAAQLPISEPADRIEPAASAAIPPGVSLFVATTFASAFLIFLVQPLVAKRILPWFGGVPAVWSLCLAFYQTTLFAGYAYAYLLTTRASARTQWIVHAVAIAAAVLALPVLPTDASRPDGSGDPVAEILAMLLANVALPFFALSATGTLISVWFSRRYPDRSPYPLYAVSNLGSLLALLAYPFALEPRLPLSATGRIWSGAFIAAGLAVIGCGFLARRTGTTAAVTAAELDATSSGSDLRAGRIALWILLPACAVVLLMGLTNTLCLDLASVPFLWIVPLAIYLSTLILCFSSERLYSRWPFVALAAFAHFAPDLALKVWTYATLTEAAGGQVPYLVAKYGLLLFASCMVLHGELFRLRPPAHRLATYYLCTSGGGALGGLAVGLVAPRVFDEFRELQLGLLLGCLLLLAAWRSDARGWLRHGGPRWRFAVALALTCLGVGYAGTWSFAARSTVLHQERSFFGVLRVEQKRDGMRTRPIRTLMHGSTLHGLQIVGLENKPTTYYGMHTGIEIALGLREEGVPAEIGVVGLGTGTLAVYGREGDHMRFFEIDPAVIRMDRDDKYFTFLELSKAKVEIIQGDGRISIARERARNAPLFDYLIVDGYSSDSVPVHLLTREALALYRESLAPSGLLAIHVSSRTFNLIPLLFRLADDAGMPVLSLQNPGAPRQRSQGSQWVFFSEDESRLDALARAAQKRHRARGLRGNAVNRPTPELLARAPLWTDDYSDLLRVLK